MRLGLTSVRRKRRPAAPSHERWLVSYADFITLLFAFFVVMYAISTVNEGKFRVVSEAVELAFRHERIVRPPDSPSATALRVYTPMPRPTAKGENLRRQREQRLVGVASKISEALKPLVQTGQVRLAQTAQGLAVEINASVLFAPGQATLQPDSIAALTAVAQVLRESGNSVHVEGHTDNVPMLGGGAYPTNWELATARASSVVRLFVAAGVDPARLAAIGYADNRPVESNETVEGRTRNRRVTLLILADGEDEQASASPAPAGTAPGGPAPVGAAATTGTAVPNPPAR